MTEMTDTPTACDECGALIADKAKHEGWHEQNVTDSKLAEVFDGMAQRGRYNP